MSGTYILQDKYILKYISKFLDHKTKINLMQINKSIYKASYPICYDFWYDVKCIDRLSNYYKFNRIRKIKNYNG